MGLHGIGKLRGGSLLGWAIAFSALPVLAQTANYEGLTLSPGFSPQSAEVTGYTGGSTSLPAVVSARDRNNQPCLGFGDPTPDHIMELTSDFDRLTVSVDSGEDTTLAILGPNRGMVRCGDDTSSGRDASISDRNWEAGTYRIWVGSLEAGERYKYTLMVSE
ncbi:hypothetical protein [Phormidium sp. CCY1219]|uniref:hypothetical protein n=1 Tax=Phormidium sp. CCY1219 TaxID=2886104 RepID=UPI002D1EE68F|nr:hypothetical protein [Phormidium sp. CCY1219]MEB3828674.1 hypothetical protein [Phormidium sp. CCY1219]